MNERRRSQSSEGHGDITVGSEGGGGGAEGGSRAREKHEAHRPRRRKLHTRGGGEGSSGPDLNLMSRREGGGLETSRTDNAGMVSLV